MCTCLIVTKKEVHGLTQVSLEFPTRELLLHVVCFAPVFRVCVGAVGNQIMAFTVFARGESNPADPFWCMPPESRFGPRLPPVARSWP